MMLNCVVIPNRKYVVNHHLVPGILILSMSLLAFGALPIRMLYIYLIETKYWEISDIALYLSPLIFCVIFIYAGIKINRMYSMGRAKEIQVRDGILLISGANEISVPLSGSTLILSKFGFTIRESRFVDDLVCGKSWFSEYEYNLLLNTILQTVDVKVVSHQILPK